MAEEHSSSSLLIKANLNCLLRVAREVTDAWPDLCPSFLKSANLKFLSGAERYIRLIERGSNERVANRVNLFGCSCTPAVAHNPPDFYI